MVFKFPPLMSTLSSLLSRRETVRWKESREESKAQGIQGQGKEFFFYVFWPSEWDANQRHRKKETSYPKNALEYLPTAVYRQDRENWEISIVIRERGED